MKPLLLGMARGDGRRGPMLMPSENGRASAADRLLQMSGMSREEFLRSFRRSNLLEHGWDFKRARIRGLKRRKRLRGTVVVLGTQTWQALGLPRMKFYDRVTTLNGATLILVPHPSGRNQVYNSARQRRRLRTLLRTLTTPSAMQAGETT